MVYKAFIWKLTQRHTCIAVYTPPNNQCCMDILPRDSICSPGCVQWKYGITVGWYRRSTSLYCCKESVGTVQCKHVEVPGCQGHYWEDIMLHSGRHGSCCLLSGWSLHCRLLNECVGKKGNRIQTGHGSGSWALIPDGFTTFQNSIIIWIPKVPQMNLQETTHIQWPFILGLSFKGLQ